MTAPGGEEEEVEAIIAALSSTFEEAQGAKTKTSKDVENLFLPVDKQLRAYGLSGCTKNS